MELLMYLIRHPRQAAALLKFGKLMFRNLDTPEEWEGVLYYMANNVNEDGQFSVPEWAHIGKLLNTLGKK